MKTKTKFLVLMVLIISFSNHRSNAQWTGNGDAVGALTTIGTISNFDFPIITFNSEKARFMTTGEFGIGTTTPTSFLHVNTSGSTNDDEPFRTVVPSSTETNWRMYKGTDQIMRITSPSSGDGVFIQSNKGDMKFSSGHNGTLTPSFMIRGGNGSDVGNVLVGDFSSSFNPTSTLHVKGRGYTSLFKVESDALTTSAYEILETEQHFFNSNTFDGSSGSAFNFDYTPSPITSGVGMSLNVQADSEYDLVGATIHAESFNTSGSAYVRGLGIVATSLGVGAPVSGLEVSSNSTVGQNVGGGFFAVILQVEI
ncbi:MAG: hypothetical protein IPN36_04565 [Bacteroidetes bacterium]|nr:hypothetical protein [Bacteroidota bacterium]